MVNKPITLLSIREIIPSGQCHLENVGSKASPNMYTSNVLFPYSDYYSEELPPISIPINKVIHEGVMLVHSSGKDDWIPSTWTNPQIFINEEFYRISINNLMGLFYLPENWDSYEGKRISFNTITRGIELLGEVFKTMDEINKYIFCPFIAPCPDGSVQLEWEFNEKELEIIIPSLSDDSLRYLLVKGEEFFEGEINSYIEVKECIEWLFKR
ncbi:MAG: hypothetical protein ACTSRP_27080 [Candidatus Helarchaeota archaeon]